MIVRVENSCNLNSDLCSASRSLFCHFMGIIWSCQGGEFLLNWGDLLLRINGDVTLLQLFYTFFFHLAGFFEHHLSVEVIIFKENVRQEAKVKLG